MKDIIKKLYKKDSKLAIKVAETLNMKIITSGIKQDVDKLTKTFALKIFSSDQKAPLKIQQRLHNNFDKFYNKLIDKYPNTDFISDRFWSMLEKRAKSWWDKKAMKGPGVDW